MTNLFLVRHGTTIWHAENRYAGATDVALHEKGRQQAKRLALWARDVGLSAVRSSPLTRARETAGPAAVAAGLILGIDEGLRELDFGYIEGKTMSEARAAFPEEIARFLVDPVNSPMPGGEDPRAAARRGQEAILNIAAANPDSRVLVVAHNSLIRLVLCGFLGIALENYRTVFPAVLNGALTELSVESGDVSLLRYNAPLP